MAVGVVTGAGVSIGRMLALGVDLLPAMGEGLLGAPVTGVGLMLAVGGSDVLALFTDKENGEHFWKLMHMSNQSKEPPSVTFLCQQQVWV